MVTLGAITLDSVPDLIVSSTALAAGYLVVALAWVVIFRTTGVLNFATGQFVFLGGLLFYSAGQQTGGSFFPALVVAVLAAAALGALTYRLLLRPLAGQPVFSTIVVTMGLAILMASVIDLVWGLFTRIIQGPVENKVFELPLEAFLTTYGAGSIVAAVVTLAALTFWLRRSRMGTQMRAAAADPLLASQGGVNISVMFAGSWAVACGLLVVAGVIFGLVTGVSASLESIGLRGLAPALVGGLDSVPGTIVGAIIVALVETFAVAAFGGDAQDPAAFGVLLAVLAVRPYGFFGTPEVRRV